MTTRARTAADVSLLAARLLSGVRTPIVGLTEQPIRVGASVGIGQGTGDDDPSEVLRRADAASYRAKRDGKGRIRHHDSSGDTSSCVDTDAGETQHLDESGHHGVSGA